VLSDGSAESEPATVTLTITAQDIPVAPHARATVVQPLAGVGSGRLIQHLPTVEEGNYILRWTTDQPLSFEAHPWMRAGGNLIPMTLIGSAETAFLAQGRYQHQITFSLGQSWSEVDLVFPVPAGETTTFFQVSLSSEQGQLWHRDGLFATDTEWLVEEATLSHEASQHQFLVMEQLQEIATLQAGIEEQIQALGEDLENTDGELDSLQTSLNNHLETVGTGLGQLENQLEDLQGLTQSTTTAWNTHASSTGNHTTTLVDLRGQVQETNFAGALQDFGQGQALLAQLVLEERLADFRAKPMASLYLPESMGGRLEAVMAAVEQSLATHQAVFGNEINVSKPQGLINAAKGLQQQGRYASAFQSLAEAYADLTQKQTRRL